MTPGWTKGEVLVQKYVDLQRCFSIVETPLMRSNTSEHLVVGGCDSGPLTFIGEIHDYVSYLDESTLGEICFLEFLTCNK